MKVNEMNADERRLERVEAGLVTKKHDGMVTLAVPTADGNAKHIQLFCSHWKDCVIGETVLDYQQFTHGYSVGFRIVGASPDDVADGVRAAMRQTIEPMVQ